MQRQRLQLTPDARKALGLRIRRLRIHYGVSKADFGRALDVWGQTIGHVERGRVAPSAAMLIRIAETLHVSTDYLLGLTDDPTPHGRVAPPGADE